MTAMTIDRQFNGTAFLDTAFPNAVQATGARSTLRLTRRGRVVVVIAALLVAFAIGVFVTAAGSVATQQPGSPEPTRIVQVGTGDTLWDIAAGLAADGDVRAVMEEIKQLNALDSGVLQAGQRLVVPAS